MDDCKLIDADKNVITKGSYLHCHDTKTVLETDPNIREYKPPLRIKTPHDAKYNNTKQYGS